MRAYKAMLAGMALLVVPGVCMAGIVIGDFESGLVADGWYVDWADTAIASDTIGATLGTQSLSMIDTNGGWECPMEFPMLDQASSNALIAAATQTGAAISMDITVPAGGIGDYLSIGVLVNANDYWNTMTYWEPLTADTAVTVVIPLDTEGKDAIAAASSYANIGIMQNAGTGFTYYIDNIQIIPEPSTIGLVGVAGIGLLVFRRRLKI